MDVHLRDLRYFVAVAEELHFRRAAERLYVSQPALSKQIRALERGLRVALLRRDRRTVSLTEAGRALLPAARELLQRWDAAQSAVAEAAAAEERALRIGFSTSVGRGVLAAAQAGFLERHPDWRLDLRQVAWSDPTAGLAEGLVDVAFVWLPLDDERYRWRLLAEEVRHVAMPASHRLVSSPRLTMRDLLEEPFLALPASAGALRDDWLALGSRGGRAPRIAATVNGADETFEAVANGLGVVLVAAGNADIYQRPGIVTRPVDDLPPARLAVAWRAADYRAVIRDFVDACPALGA